MQAGKVVRRCGSALVVALVAVGCTTTEPARYIYKAGATRVDKQAALDACKIDSFQRIPQSVVSETNGGYYNPGHLQCSTVGTSTNCYRVGAVNIPATTNTYDVNEGLRGRFIAQCLVNKGYSVVDLPACPTPEAKAEAQKAADSGQLPKCATGRNLDY